MKMVSMKFPKAKKGADKGMTAVAVNEAKDEYPYGLRLSLNEDQIKKLDGLFDLDVEGKLVIHAEAHVSSKSSNEQQAGKPERRMEIQITGMACMPTGKDYETDTGWYDNMKAEKKK